MVDGSYGDFYVYLFLYCFVWGEDKEIKLWILWFIEEMILWYSKFFKESNK